MVFLAFSLQEQVEKYGAYIGIAAFFGLAILSLLYFAQAREVKRLREWAGRSPERAAELEEAYGEYAQPVRRAPTPVVQAQPRPIVQAQPVQVAPANGVVQLKPEEVAALAFARAAGVHQPHEPKPHPVPAVASATAAAPPTRTVADIPPAPVPAATNGGGAVPPPPPATPAARRLEPLPPRRTQQVPPRRGAAPPPPRRESGTRAIVIAAIIAVLVLAGVGYLFTQIGGDSPSSAGGSPTPAATNALPTPDANPDDEADATPTPAPGVSKEDAQVVVFNGTSVTGLAGTYKKQLVAESYPEGNLEAATLGEDEQRTTSTVMYARGDKTAAQQVADVLGIDRVEQLSEAIQTAAATVEPGREWNVVAIIGQDKSTS